MTSDTTVVDDVENRRLLCRDAGVEAELRYRVNGKRLILIHTDVPEALRGRGIAGRLMRAAVERAEAEGEVLVPWCPYVRTWLQDHVDVASRVAIDWTEPPAP
jgi:predicted GNAT family acetyltransferase